MIDFEHTEYNFTVKIVNKDIADLIDKALNEGSCLHWCYNIESKYNDDTSLENMLANDGVLLVYGIERVYELTKDKLVMGIQRALPYLNLLSEGNTLDISSVDSDGADLIIQLALFNKLVFD